VTVSEPNRWKPTVADTASLGCQSHDATEPVPTGELRQHVTYPAPGTAVLAVAGEVDMGTATRLEEMLQSRLCSQLRQLVLDLSHVAFLGVAGVSAISAAELRARCSGATLIVVTGGNRPVTRALRATTGHHSLCWHAGPVASALVGGGNYRVPG